MVGRLIIVHLKTQTNHVIEPNLGCFQGPKMDCKRDHCAPIAFQIIQFGAHMQKIWLLVALSPITSKPKFTNQLLDLSSSNVNLVNTHTTFDTCQQSMPSPNIFIFKSMNILRKDGHIYSMVEINIQNRATNVW